MNQQNKATFKIKRDSVLSDQKPKDSNKMLSSDEISQICENYCLSRKQVYNIRSTFTSMCELSQNWLATQTGYSHLV
jgi:hypothetical protein